MIDASSNKNVTNETTDANQDEGETETAFNVTDEKSEVNSSENKIDQNQVLIKTETRTGYVNIDGTEREKVKNESTLRDILKERISSYYNNTNPISMANNSKQTNPVVPPEDQPTIEPEPQTKVEVDDIIIPQRPQEMEKLQPPSSTRAKEAFKMLPKVLQDFLNSDWSSKHKCEPQHMLERIRKEKRYPEHPDVDRYELLLTPAPSFLQRISLAGEFLTKKQLEM